MIVTMIRPMASNDPNAIPVTHAARQRNFFFRIKEIPTIHNESTPYVPTNNTVV